MTKEQLLDPARIRKRLREGGAAALVSDFAGERDPDVRRVATALERSLKAITEDPSQLAAQLAGRLGDHPLVRALREPGALIPRTASLDAPDGPEVRALLGHTNFVGGLVVLEDGRTVVSSSEDSTVRVWDLESGAEKARLDGGRMPVNHLAKSLDGRFLVAACDDRTVKVWDTKSWKLLRTLEGHTDFVSRVVPTVTNGVLSASKDDTVRIWDIETGKPFAELPSPGWNTVAAVSPDGRLAITCSVKHVMKAWDVERAAERKTLVDCSAGYVEIPGFASLYINAKNTSGVGHPDGAPHDVAFSPDGTRFFSVEKELIEWDAATLAPVRTSSRLAWTVNRLLILPGGKLVALGVKEIHLCELATGKEVAVLTGHRDAISSLACTPDGRFLLSGSKDNSIRVWDVAAALSRTAVARHSGNVQALAIAPGGRHAVTGSADGTAAVWEIATGARIRELPHAHPFVESLDFAPDGKSFVTSTGQGDMHHWRLDGTEIGRFPDRKRLYQTKDLAFMPDGTLVTAAALTEPLLAWDVAARKATPFEGATNNCGSILPRPGRTEVVTIGSDFTPKPPTGTLQVWDVASRKLVRTMSPPSGYYSAVALSADGALALAGRDGALELWDLDRGEIVSRGDAAGWVYSIHRLPDGTLLAVSRGKDSPTTLSFWDPSSRRERRSLSVEALAQEAAAVSPDGSRAAIVGERLWLIDLATGKTLASFTSDDRVMSAAFAPDGTIVCGDLEGRVHFLQAT